MDNYPIPARGAAAPRASRSRAPRGFTRQLAEIQETTALRRVAVQGAAITAREKVSELDYLIWKAMAGHAMISGWANQLAGDNPVLADDLRFFEDTARLGKGEIIVDTINVFHEM
jgi:hypothetical protein